MKFRILIILFILFSGNKDLFAQGADAKNFKLSLRAKYMSRFTAYGIDLAEDQPAFALASSLSHESGISLGIHLTQPNDNGDNLRQWSFGLGFDKEILSGLTLTAEFGHYLYNSASINVLSSFSNSISAGADVDMDFVDIGISFDQFLGGSGATYFGFDISTFIDAGSIYVLPIVYVSFISQTIEGEILTKLKGKNKRDASGQATETDFSGLASTMTTIVFIYPLAENIYISFVPTGIWSHRDDLSSESFRFVWNAGLRYRITF
jgi:hypothetical protein